MNPPIDEADNHHNRALTQNGAAALKSTLSATVDFFGLRGALRSREGGEVSSLFSKAFAGDESDTLDVLWKALPNYSPEQAGNGMVVADVSGSMSGRPMAVSVALAMYISERNQGALKNLFITFSDEPSLQRVEGGADGKG